MTGRTLGHYQVLEKIGSGGMGEVYKARDTRLNRFVAVKVLPPDKFANADRKRRFIREAQSASALNHPNIVVIHDAGEQDGTDYIVMEYIAGQTLDSMIPKQGMRLGDALKIAIPVADGLAKAHSAGIVHRDLKPSNIMIAEDGRVKILDFGLAKLTEAPVSSEESTRIAQPKTEDGAVLGTVAYMSPEQAEAKKVDARSDIFSFGALLYEMVSGRRAFEGDSRMSTLARILREEPKALEGQPAELDRIVRRCLRKDAARRFQSIADLRVELEEIRDESESGKLIPPAIPRPGRRWGLPFAGALAAVLAAGIVWFVTRPKSPAEFRLRQLTADSGLTTDAAVSADGRMVVYASDRGGGGVLHLWVHPLTEGARPLQLTKDASDDFAPSFSPDGGQIVFSRGNGGIYLIPALGGDERVLVRGGYFPRFSPDGRWIAYSTAYTTLLESRVFIVPVSGGTPKRIGEDIPLALTPVWSPDGKHLLILGEDDPGNGRSIGYWLSPVTGGKSRKAELARFFGESRIDHLTNVDWRDRSIVFAAGNTVWAFDFPPDSLQPSNLRRISTGASSLGGLRGTQTRFVLSAGTNASHLWTLPLDLNSGKVTGALQPVFHGGGSQVYATSSRDGSVLAYTQRGPAGGEIRVRDRRSGKESVLLAEPVRAKVSPDGSKIAYSGSSLTGPGGSGPIHLMDATGGPAQKLVDLEKGGALYSWTSDGRALIFYRLAPLRWYLYDFQTGKDREIISHPKLDIHGVEPSPDWKWIAFHLPAVTNTPIHVAPLRDGHAAGESEWITVARYPGRNARPWWSPDGNLLYFLSLKDGYGDIWAQRLDPLNKRPVGDAFAVWHFHEKVRSPKMSGTADFGPAIGTNEITFALQEQLGNIWIGEQGQ